MGDRYDVYFQPPAANALWSSGRPHSKPRVLLIAHDRSDPKLRTQRDITRMREFTGIDLTVMDAEDCTKKDILAAMSGDYAVVHFSCHGLFDPFQPGRSALVLSTKAADVRPGNATPGAG